LRRETKDVLLKRTVRITVTHERIVSLRGGGDELAAAWCPRCAATVTMLTPHQAASVAGVGTRDIFRWLESDRLHFIETTSLSPLVCLESLPSGATREGTGGEPGTRGFNNHGV
jgi:hypothetical protein